jgi:hypothetical protein
VLAYAIDEAFMSRRGAILADFRSSDAIQRLFDRAVVARGRSAPARASLGDPSLGEVESADPVSP